MSISKNTFFLMNSFWYLIINVRSQTYAYDYGYATNPNRYTRKVHLKQGTLQGVVVDPRINRALPPVEQYLGIPYAAAPTRELRFMPPGSAPQWSGTKIADSFGPVCPQKLPQMSNMGPERADYFDKLSKHLILNQSEDCLYLNIYAPVQDYDFPPPVYPVMVFLHGESFEWNSGNPYDGSVLAAYGKVIVVTMNFRLGIFGFLKTGLEESASSNFGLVDQVAGLLWVQENIAAFGGDANSVTIFGHGTGAVCANLLMLSPMIIKEGSKMLFRRVILMGGTALSDWALATTPRQVTFQVAEGLNCPSNEARLAECLRTRNPNDILNVSVTTDYFRTRFGPIIDARIIPNHPKHIMTKFNDVFKSFELMYGVTEVESAHLLGPVGLTHGLLEKERDQELMRYLRIRCEFKPELCLARTLQEYAAREAGNAFGEQAESGFAGAVPSKATLARDKLLDMLSDARSVAPITQMGRLHSVVNAQSYFYVFGHTTASRQHLRNKSVHGDELPYLFGVPIDGPKFHFTDHYSPNERLFSEVIMTYFTNFAHTGNPNMPRKTEYYTLNPIDWLKFEVEWPEYDVQDEAYLHLAIPPEVRYHYRSSEVRFWNEILPDLLNRKPTFKPSVNAPPWLHPKPISKGTATDNLDIFDTFYKQPTRPPTVYGTIKHNGHGTRAPDKVEYGTVITAEPEAEAKTSNATNLLIIVGCLFLLVNIFVFAGLYYKCVRLKNKERQRREEYQAGNLEVVDEKNPKVPESPLDGCNLMRIISKSSKSEDIYEAVKVSEDGSNARFKLMRQVSSSTIDPHTKVRDWIAQEIVQRCSPRFLRRTKQQLAEEQNKAAQQKGKVDVSAAEAKTVGSNSTLGQSPTRPVSPEDKPSINIDTKGGTIKSGKVSVAVDATPAGRGNSVMCQQPIELTKSLEVSMVNSEPQLRRSFTMEDVVNLPEDNLRRTSTSISLKIPQMTDGGLKIQHHHSKSDPVKDLHLFANILPKKLKSFEPEIVNVTSREEAVGKVQPLTIEQQLQTIKRRNFPKVLPDFPQSKESLANKRRSMPAQGYLNLPIPEMYSFSQPTSPTGKCIGRLPPAPPPRTTSTLARKLATPRICQTPAALAEEPPLPLEPEVTYNNLYIGPLIPTSTPNKKSGSATDLYKQNIQQIYDHLKPPQTTSEQKVDKREVKAIITTDSEHPVKKAEPKVVIKPTIAKKTIEQGSTKVGARVVARNSSDEKFDVGGLPKNGKDDTEGNFNHPIKPPKPSHIPTFTRLTTTPTKKEPSSSSESTPSEESDTGTVVKRV